jgi:RNA polymerase sigma-70 factor, ECF subfamily
MAGSSVGAIESEVEAAARARERDTARRLRFEHLVTEQRDRAFGLAWRLLGADRSAAEDVVQEALIRAHRSLAQFRDEAALSTWFYRILIREVRRHQLRRSVRERWERMLAQTPARSAAPEPTDPALRERIGAALELLSRGQREAFVLVHLESFTVQQAAQTLGKSVGTLKSHLHRALRTLRAELADLREEAR